MNANSTVFEVEDKFANVNVKVKVTKFYVPIFKLNARFAAPNATG